MELLLVVLAMSFLFFLSAPFFSGGQDARQTGRAAERAASLLRYARVRAMTEQVLYRFVAEGRELSVHKASAESGSRGQAVFEPVGTRYILPEGVYLEGAPQTVYCYPDGHMDRTAFLFKGKKAVFVVSTKEYIGHVLVREENTRK